MRNKNASREKTSIKSFKSSDISDDIMLWVQRPEIYRFTNDVPPWNREDCKKLLRAHIDMAHVAPKWFKSICFDQKSVGAVSVTWHRGPVDACRAGIEFAVGPEFWGRGIAAEAVRKAVTDVTFPKPSLKRIEAVVDVDNVAAHRVLEKVGFQKEGVLRQYYELRGNPRDMVMYSLLSKP